MTYKGLLFFISVVLNPLLLFASSAREPMGMVSGKVLSADGNAVDYATVFLKDSRFSCITDERGLYHIKAPAGNYTIVFSSVGFEKMERKVEIPAGGRIKLSVKLQSATQLA